MDAVRLKASGLYLIGKSDDRFGGSVPVAEAIRGTSVMRRLVAKLVVGLGLAPLADAIRFLSRRASYRVNHKPLAGPRPGSWLPG